MPSSVLPWIPQPNLPAVLMSGVEKSASSESSPTEVEITVAGHTIAIKATAPMDEVAAQALGLFQQTQEYAKRAPIGFDTPGGLPPLTPSDVPQESEGSDERSMG